MESFLEEACNREGKLAKWGKGSFGVGGWQRRDRAGEGRGGWIYLVTWNKSHQTKLHRAICSTWTTNSCPHGRGSHQVSPVQVMLSFSQERSNRTSNRLKKKKAHNHVHFSKYYLQSPWGIGGNSLQPPPLSIFWNTWTIDMIIKIALHSSYTCTRLTWDKALRWYAWLPDSRIKV